MCVVRTKEVKDLKGKKYDRCNYCDMTFPRRRRGEKTHPERFKNPVPSRIEHLNDEHSEEIGERVTLKNYRKYLHYSEDE